MPSPVLLPHFGRIMVLVSGRDEWRMGINAGSPKMRRSFQMLKQAHIGHSSIGRCWRQIVSSVTIVKALIHIAWEKTVVKHSCIFTKKTHIDRSHKTIDIIVSDGELLTCSWGRTEDISMYQWCLTSQFILVVKVPVRNWKAINYIPTLGMKLAWWRWISHSQP